MHLQIFFLDRVRSLKTCGYRTVHWRKGPPPFLTKATAHHCCDWLHFSWPISSLRNSFMRFSLLFSVSGVLPFRGEWRGDRYFCLTFFSKIACATDKWYLNHIKECLWGLRWLDQCPFSKGPGGPGWLPLPVSLLFVSEAVASIRKHWLPAWRETGPANFEPCGSAVENPSVDAGDSGLSPGSGRSSWRRKWGNSNSLQCSCLEIPWTDLQSMGSQRVGHDWVTKTVKT